MLIHNVMSRGAMVAFAAEGDPPPAPPPPPPPPPPPVAQWHDTLDADTKAYIANNLTADGKADPLKAFAEAAKAHQAAQAYIGVKPEQLIRLPGDDNPDAWKDVWRKLGAPDSPDKYDFTTVKKADGTPIDQADTDFIRATAAKLNLPVAAAQALAAEIQARQDRSAGEAQTALAGRVAEQKTALRTSWAQNYEANEFVAKQAMASFGLNADQIAAIQDSPNVASAMETWRQIGMRIGEDRFVHNGGGGGPRQQGAATLEEASARRAELMSDGDWSKRFLAGGVEEKRTMAQLDQVIATAKANGA